MWELIKCYSGYQFQFVDVEEIVPSAKLKLRKNFARGVNSYLYIQVHVVSII